MDEWTEKKFGGGSIAKLEDRIKIKQTNSGKWRISFRYQVKNPAEQLQWIIGKSQQEQAADARDDILDILSL